MIDQLPVFERKEIVGAIVHQDLMQGVAGGDDYAEIANRPVKHFMRPPSRSWTRARAPGS